MITLTTIDIIKIVITILQIIFYLIIFVKLHNLKSNKSLTIGDILKKGKELFINLIGTPNIESIINLFRKTENKDNHESEDNKDNG